MAGETVELEASAREALDEWYTGNTDDPSKVIMYMENVLAELAQTKKLADELERERDFQCTRANANLLTAQRIRISRLRLREALEPVRVFVEHFVPVEEARINGFDVDAWCELADTALGEGSQATEEKI